MENDDDFMYEEYYEKLICELEDRAGVYEKQLYELEHYIDQMEQQNSKLERKLQEIYEEVGMSDEEEQYICLYLKDGLDDYIPSGWYCSSVDEDYNFAFPDSSIRVEQYIVDAVMQGHPYFENDDIILCEGIIDYKSNVIRPNFEREDIEDAEFEISE